MRWPALTAGALLALSVAGCDKIPFLSKKSGTTDSTQVAAQPADTQPAAPVDTQPAPRTTPPVAQRPRRPLTDEPWTPVDTGTVAPGMTHDQVVALWGPPEVERSVGNHQFLYFRNGCEVTCGTYDVVFLEDGQVVDAIVRGQGHNYAGVSSSPRDRKAEFTKPAPPGGTMGLP